MTLKWLQCLCASQEDATMSCLVLTPQTTKWTEKSYPHLSSSASYSHPRTTASNPISLGASANFASPHISAYRPLTFKCPFAWAQVGWFHKKIRMANQAIQQQSTTLMTFALLAKAKSNFMSLGWSLAGLKSKSNPIYVTLQYVSHYPYPAQKDPDLCRVRVFLSWAGKKQELGKGQFTNNWSPKWLLKELSIRWPWSSPLVNSDWDCATEREDA